MRGTRAILDEDEFPDDDLYDDFEDVEDEYFGSDDWKFDKEREARLWRIGT